MEEDNTEDKNSLCNSDLEEWVTNKKELFFCNLTLF